MNFVALLQANIFEDQLAILFYLPIVEYFVSILGHQHNVVGNLAIAMAETAQFQRISHPTVGGWHHLWLRASSLTNYKKKQRLSI